MAVPRFLDTTILLRSFTGADREKARRAKALLERVERREEKVVTSLLVVFETLFTLQRTYRVPRPQIREMLRDVLSLPGLQLPGKGLCLQALDVYVARNISFADTFNAVYLQARGLAEIYSWDADFDQIPGLKHVEPSEQGEAAS